MSVILSAELAAACSALGSFDPKTNNYYGDDNILETVKDLIRYLRRDTESHEVRRHFGTAKILQINLIPLLKLYWQQTDLFDVLLRLLGNLTSPVLLLYNEEIPKEKTARNHFLQILGHLQSYKEAFADYDLWAVLCTRLSQLLEVEWQDRGEENGLIIERILILVRNVLSVPADLDAEKRPDNDVSAHDKVLWSLRKSGLVDIVLYMVSSDQEECYYLYLLEILSLMLREHRPSDLANAAITRTESEKAQDEAEFLAVRRSEMTKKNERMKSYTSARHSRFGGTFVFKNVKSVNDEQELIYHKALNKANILDFDSDKAKVKTPKNRLPLHESTSFRRSTFSIRLLLKDFCIEFLNAGYNKLMQNVRGKLIRGKSVTHDETYYLWALKFFMEFNRHHKFDVKLVSETMSVQIFHYVQQQMEHSFDMINSDKKKWPLWSKRLQIALQAYKEMLFSLVAMEKSQDDSVRQSAKVIKSNVLYVVEYREFVLTLLLTYNPLKMSDAYLLDLLETQHVFLKMFEAFCGKGDSIVVQKKKKMRQKKKKQAAPVVNPEEDLNTMWDEIAPELSSVMEGGENIPDIVPFNAGSDIPIDDQKKDAMIRIQNYLRDNEVENALGLLRSAREVWPENDSFGNSRMSPAEEFLAIREIFFAELQERRIPVPAPVVEDDEEEDEEEEDIDMNQEREINFSFNDFVYRFAHPKVVQACGLALRHFDTNPVNINHYVLKLLHRISWDCRMPAMVFQASIFRTFQRIFSESHRTQYKELVKFATYIVRQFAKVAESNKKVFVELLFWKNNKEAFDCEQGYGMYQEKAKLKGVWTEEEENELRVLVAEHKDRGIQEDMVNWVTSNLVDNTKTRRMVIVKLKTMMLLDGYKGPKKSSASSRPPKEWEAHEITELTELYNQFKDAGDPLNDILDRLSVKRSKGRIKEKILELGLADDAKSLWKQRKKRTAGEKSRTEDTEDENAHSDSLQDSSSGENNSDTETQRSNISTKVKQVKAKSIKRARNVVKRAEKPHKMDETLVKKLARELIAKDKSEALKWICECFTDAAEDQDENSGNEGIPLVPIAAEEVEAMGNFLFKKLLIAVGIKKPADEQEIYWRIPASKKAEDLLHISSVLNGILEAPEEEEPAVNAENLEEAQRKKDAENQEEESEQSDNEDAENPEETQEEDAKNQEEENEQSDVEDAFSKLRKFISKSDDEHLDPDLQMQWELSNSDKENNKDSSNDFRKKKLKKKRILEVSDDSSIENNPPDAEINSNSTTEEKRKNVDAKAGEKLKRKQRSEDFDESNTENNLSEGDINSDTAPKAKGKMVKAKATKKLKKKQMLEDTYQYNSENYLPNAEINSDSATEAKGKKAKATEKLKKKRRLEDESVSENNLPDAEIKTASASKAKGKKVEAKASKKRRIVDLEDSDSENSEMNVAELGTEKPTGKEDRNILQSDEESDENSRPLNMTDKKGKRTKKRVQALEDSEESERDIEKSQEQNSTGSISGNNEEENNKIAKTTKRVDLEESESENEERSKRARESDSDSQNSKLKKKRAVVIDSEDEN